MPKYLVQSTIYLSRFKLTGTGTSSSDRCSATCVTSDDGVKTCSFTAALNQYASYMGYWIFAECGATVMPVLETEGNE